MEAARNVRRRKSKSQSDLSQYRTTLIAAHRNNVGLTFKTYTTFMASFTLYRRQSTGDVGWRRQQEKNHGGKNERRTGRRMGIGKLEGPTLGL